MLRSQRVLEIILFFGILGLYAHNLPRSIFPGDSGLLVSTSFVGGIPHPPGYPLFTILGFLITRISLLGHMSPALLVGFLSAFFSSLTCLLYFRLAFHFSKNLLISCISTLTLTSIYQFWLIAETPEVFALNNFFILLLLYISIVFSKTKSNKYLYLLTFFTGLSLTNHLSIVLIFPSLLFIIFPQLKRLFIDNKLTLLKALLFATLGILPYLYIVTASFLHPVIDWAHLKDVQSFISFISRERYGSLKAGYFDNPNITSRQAALGNYWFELVKNVTIPVLVLCTIGLSVEMWKKTRVGISIFLAFILSGPLFFMYAGFPFDTPFYISVAERFIVMSIVIVMLFLPLGIHYFSQKLGSYFSRPLYTVLFCGIFLLIPLQLFLGNYAKLNFSKAEAGTILGKNYLKILPKNSIVLLASDTSLFTTLYAHYVEQDRHDVTVLNAIDPSEVNTVLRTKSSIVDNPSDLKAAQAAFLKNIEIVDNSYPIFSEVPFEGNAHIKWIPFGLVYELRRNTEHKFSLDEYRSRTSSIWEALSVPHYKELTDGEKNSNYSSVYNAYAWALWHTGVYFSSTYNDPQDYAEYIFKSVEVYPEFSLGYASLGSYFMSVQNNCSLALIDYKQAIDKDQLNKKYYQLLANTQKQCHTNNAEVNSLKDRYKKLFHQTLSAS